MHKEIFSFRVRMALVLALVIYISTIVSLGLISQSGMGLVFVGTIPVLLYLILFFALFDYEQVHLWFSWTAPLVICIAFYYLWQSGIIPILNAMEGPTLTVLNLLISYLINLFFFFVLAAGSRPKVKTVIKQDENLIQQQQNMEKQIKFLESQIIHYQNQLHVTKQNFGISLKGIEDKCKAINFVIGRVYSDKHGGNPEIRNKLKIDSGLYNTFSTITADFKHTDALRLLSLLGNVQKKLSQFEAKEPDLIKIEKNAKIPLPRNTSDTIIDIMAKNDKDPIKEYYSQAKEVCEKLIEFVRANYSSQ